ncbi:hypothetical protein Tco_0071233 [Tanacetum coccineum]
MLSNFEVSTWAGLLNVWLKIDGDEDNNQATISSEVSCGTEKSALTGPRALSHDMPNTTSAPSIGKTYGDIENGVFERRRSMLGHCPVQWRNVPLPIIMGNEGWESNVGSHFQAEELRWIADGDPGKPPLDNRNGGQSPWLRRVCISSGESRRVGKGVVCFAGFGRMAGGVRVG